MKEIFVVADNVLSPLGYTTSENFGNMLAGRSGIQQHQGELSAAPFFASLIPHTQPGSEPDQPYTRFEQLVIASMEEALSQTGIDAQDPGNLFILSSTKGNISLLETAPFNAALKDRISLHHSAKLVAARFNLATQPLVVSHACISGVLAIITAVRLMQSGRYKNAIISGADIISKFIFSGFQSFQAVSNKPCRPFDADRDGITLGEAAGTIILSVNKDHTTTGIRVCGGAANNDANHISGPSRTGRELFSAISDALGQAGIAAHEIDFISAHGTATVYNDEMEAKAFDLAGMNNIPVNSLKGYYGHTLGAAGIIESVISVQSLYKGAVLPTPGFSRHGVSKNLHICTSVQTGGFTNFLKTASGFGGCNAAIIFSK